MCSASAFAQPIKDHPQKAFYASPAEWPTDSAQCHWSPSDAVPPAPVADGSAMNDLVFGRFGAMVGHTHVDMKFPRQAITTTESFPITFTLKIFHTAGSIGILQGQSLRDITLDNGVTLPIVGNPHGLVVVTGHAVVDPLYLRPGADPSQRAPAHGWYSVGLFARTTFTNGARVDAILYEPLYSMIDPSQPERSTGSLGIPLRAFCMASGPGDKPTDLFGANVTEFHEPVPIAPISQPWPITYHTYGYGASAGLPAGVARQLLDPDIHNGVTGPVLSTVTIASGTAVPTVIDPGVMGAGPHHQAFVWTQSTGDGSAFAVAGQQVSTLLVIDTNVGDDVPPPPPPPPPLKHCTGTVQGTSVDGIVVTPISPIQWSCS